MTRLRLEGKGVKGMGVKGTGFSPYVTGSQKDSGLQPRRTPGAWQPSAAEAVYTLASRTIPMR